MEKIDSHPGTVKDVLGTKYEIDVFQREYVWQTKHIEQLITDLTLKFLSNYKPDHPRKQVGEYSRYFLGPIILSRKGGINLIIDGQQRLTSVTLLLIYLNNLQKETPGGSKPPIDGLIYSVKYGLQSYNLQVEERQECMRALYNDKLEEFRNSNSDESVTNIIARYNDIMEEFPEDLKGEALPYFIDWLTDNVIFVVIETPTDEDAYTIFETMNDRGLNLTPTDMLKGYLLSHVVSPEEKNNLNKIWKERVYSLKKIYDNEDLEFFKAWLRGKYAGTIRQSTGGAENEDFEKIATRFQAWVKDNSGDIGLKGSEDFVNFIKKDFSFFSKIYEQIDSKMRNFDQNYEYLYYLYLRGFPRSLMFPLLMAPIEVHDDEGTRRKKISLVSRFLETFLVFRAVNSRTVAQSYIKNGMYSLVKTIRGKTVDELASIFKQEESKFEDNLSGVKDLTLRVQYVPSVRFIHYILARITRHIEKQAGIASGFVNYIYAAKGEKPFQIEHVWADIYDRHRGEFSQEKEFEQARNKIGDLLLIPEGPNQSWGSMKYEEKLPQYFGQNLLAKSLHPDCYKNNPSFDGYIAKSGLPFKPLEHFTYADIKERQYLYQKICEEIWNIDGYDKIAKE